MEYDMQSKRHAIVALFLAGKRPKDILCDLEPIGVGERLIHRTIKRYKETNSVEKRYGGGRRRSVTTPENIKKLAECLRRNPRRSARKLARDIGISNASLRRILKRDLQVKAYKIQKVHGLSEKQRQVRLERSAALLERYARGEFPNLIFSDEKIFTIEQSVNKQNDRVYLTNRSSENAGLLQASRRQAPASVMVWGAISASGRSPLVFLPRGTKVNAHVYREKVLEAALLPWVDSHFHGQQFCFQQDSAPSHKARDTQNWLKMHVPRFIGASDWPPCSPDLNPLDFSIWGILESRLSAKKHKTVKQLITRLCREWDRIPDHVIRAACEAFEGRLRKIINAKGGHIE